MTQNDVSRCGTTPEPLRNHLRNQVVPESLRPLKGGGASEPDGAKKFPTKQARNREANRVKKLERQNAKGYKSPRSDIVSKAMLEKAAREMQRIRAAGGSPSSRRESIDAARKAEAVRAEQSRQLYRETKAERMPALREREADLLGAIRAAVKRADADAEQLRNGGRPRKRSLPPMLLGRKVDALLNAVPEWQGQR